ncbi:MAG: hypothetical protein WDO73_22710 [Ignavibacteriota bacterium]
MEHVQMRDARWCIVDLVGKQGKARTIPMAAWTKLAIDEWTAAAGIAEGRVFRPVAVQRHAGGRPAVAADDIQDRA